jgi:hypothetical protein
VDRLDRLCCHRLCRHRDAPSSPAPEASRARRPRPCRRCTQRDSPRFHGGFISLAGLPSGRSRPQPASRTRRSSDISPPRKTWPYPTATTPLHEPVCQPAAGRRNRRHRRTAWRVCLLAHPMPRAWRSQSGPGTTQALTIRSGLVGHDALLAMHDASHGTVHTGGQRGNATKGEAQAGRRGEGRGHAVLPVRQKNARPSCSAHPVTGLPRAAGGTHGEPWYPVPKAFSIHAQRYGSMGV